MADRKQQPTYLSYLLRLWRDHPQAPWRASLESTATGDVRRFGDIEGMWAFLQAQLEHHREAPASVAPPDAATRRVQDETLADSTNLERE